MANVTIIGPRNIGKTVCCNIIANKMGLEYVQFDRLLDEYLVKFGGLVEATKNDELYTALSIWSPNKMSEILENDGQILELGASAICSVYEDVNELNYQTISTNSVFIPLMYSGDVDLSARVLFERERGLTTPKAETTFDNMKKTYLDFATVIDKYDTEPVYTIGKNINDVVHLIMVRLN